MGLEPMALRLKVWCSTDWANRAPVVNGRESLINYFLLTYRVTFVSESDFECRFILFFSVNIYTL